MAARRVRAVEVFILAIPSEREGAQQAGQRARHRNIMCCIATIFLSVPVLTGCASVSADPFDWWNNLEGGAIAAQRPPPPGATDPYQPVELMPAKPAPLDAASRLRIANSLAADQATAEEIGAENPLAAKTGANSAPLVSHPAAAPTLPATPAPDPTAATASFQAASAAPAPQPSATKPAPPRTGPFPPIAEAAPPAIPAGPPPRPANLPEDFSIPTAVPDISRLVTPLVPNVSQPVTFRTGQAGLTQAATIALRALVAARAGHAIRIIARGEATAYDPATQTRALRLAIERAQAIADVLRRGGLPPSAMRIEAEPFGRGGAAILIT